MAKAKEQTEEFIEPQVNDTAALIDRSKPQFVFFDKTSNGREFKLGLSFRTPSNFEYFSFQTDFEEKATRAQAKQFIDVDAMSGARVRVGRKLLQARDGYKNNDNLDSTAAEDLAEAVKAFFAVQIPESESEKTDELFDETAENLTSIEFYVLQSSDEFAAKKINNYSRGVHYFGDASQADLDEFLAITQNAPLKNNLASSVKLSEAEKLHRLGIRLLKSWDGYADAEKPAPWEIAATTKSFFLQLAAKYI